MKKRQRILVVDDEPANIKVLMDIFKDNCSVVAATTGEKALKLANADEAPDIVLLDIMMPGMDGFEVCKKLKSEKKTKYIPVIFITAMDQIVDEERGLKLGAVDYITKPISPSLVKQRVQTHLELAQRTKQLQAEKMINDSELDMAKRIQNFYIANQPPFNDVFDIASYYKPMRAIGGDLIDYFLDNHGNIGIMLADVSGHGIPAALITAMLKVFNLKLYNQELHISRFLSQLNDSLSQIISGQFVTVLLGQLNLQTKSFIFNNSGQSYPFIYRKNENKVMKLKTEGTAIGMFQGIKLKNPVEIKLEHGDKLLLFTDGITEALDQNVLSGEKWLSKKLMSVSNHSPMRIVNEITTSLKQELEERGMEFSDDLSLICISLK